jgi:hypothetical protein
VVQERDFQLQGVIVAACAVTGSYLEAIVLVADFAAHWLFFPLDTKGTLSASGQRGGIVVPPVQFGVMMPWKQNMIPGAASFFKLTAYLVEFIELKATGHEDNQYEKKRTQNCDPFHTARVLSRARNYLSVCCRS